MDDIIQQSFKPKDISPTIQETAHSLIDRLTGLELSYSEIARLKLLIPNTHLDIHAEIRLQHAIVKSIQSRILNENNEIHESASAKEIATIVTAFNSYLNLYLRSMERINRDKQLQDIESAIADVVSSLPEEEKELFMSKLKGKLDIN